MKISKLCAIIMAGFMVCTAPAAVMASDTQAAISAAEELLEDNQIDAVLSDPDKAADIIIYVKDMIDGQDITDQNIYDAIDMAATEFGISLSDSDRESLFNIAKNVRDMDIDEEELRSNIKSVYEKLEELGIGKEEVKSFLEKAIDFVKGILG